MANHATHSEPTLAETPLPGTRSGPYTDIGEGRTVRSGKPGLMARHRDTLLVTALMAALVTTFAAVIGAAALSFISVNQSLLTVRGEIGDLRAEMHEEIGSLRTEMHEEIGSLRTEMHEEIGALRTEMHEEIGALRTEMHEEIGALRTEMHEEIGQLSERVTRIEERLTGIEATLAILLDRLPPRDEAAAPAGS